jgi:hypothetical protein
MRGNWSDADRKGNHRWIEKLMEAAAFFQGVLEMVTPLSDANEDPNCPWIKRLLSNHSPMKGSCGIPSPHCAR